MKGIWILRRLLNTGWKAIAAYADICQFISRVINMERAPRPVVNPVEVAQINLGALIEKDDEANVIIKGPIKVEIKRSKVSNSSF